MAARLPCLTTGTPQAATTIAAAVEMLTVPAPSPPVPHVSSRESRAIPLSQRVIRSRTAATAPSSSSAVSPLIRKAVRNAAWRRRRFAVEQRSRTAARLSDAREQRPAAERFEGRVRGFIKAPGPCAVPSRPCSAGRDR